MRARSEFCPGQRLYMRRTRISHASRPGPAYFTYHEVLRQCIRYYRIVRIRTRDRRSTQYCRHSKIIRNIVRDYWRRSIAGAVVPFEGHRIHSAVNKHRIIGQRIIVARCCRQFSGSQRLHVRRPHIRTPPSPSPGNGSCPEYF